MYSERVPHMVPYSAYIRMEQSTLSVFLRTFLMRTGC